MCVENNESLIYSTVDHKGTQKEVYIKIRYKISVWMFPGLRGLPNKEQLKPTPDHRRRGTTDKRSLIIWATQHPWCKSDNYHPS